MENFENHCELPTDFGTFVMYDTGDEDVHTIVFDNIENLTGIPLVRIQSSCIASEIFNAVDCDCADQLKESMRLISEEGQGIIIHLTQEGRGHGLSKKIEAVSLMQEKGLDTVEAFEFLKLEQDVRDYKKATDILSKLGIEKIRLITNNPSKIESVEAQGIEVVESIKTNPTVREENFDYLISKNDKLGHEIPIEDD